MLIAQGLHLFLGGQTASDSLDCQAYAVETSGGMLLFDTGAGRGQNSLKQRLQALPHPVAACFLTHAHADHSGGAAIIARAGASVYASAATGRIVESGDEAAMSLDAARRAGIYPPEYRFAACPNVTPIKDGETLRFSDIFVTAHATPGHSHDHYSYRVTRANDVLLMAGDGLFADGRVLLQDIWDCSISETCRTIEALARLSFDALLPGHGDYVLQNAMRHVEIAANRVRRLLTPELFI
jgi:glyoxylase-like metal-dependent hydrolase (beta-lactamase superfamily II)